MVLCAYFSVTLCENSPKCIYKDKLRKIALTDVLSLYLCFLMLTFVLKPYLLIPQRNHEAVKFFNTCLWRR